MSVLNKTNKKGDELELYVSQKINSSLGEGTSKIIGGLGKENDAVGGVDVVVNIDGKENTAQVKPIYSITQAEGQYLIKIKGIVKDYETDLLIFAYMGGKIFIFKNENVDASGDHFKIPTENLINEIN